MRRGAVLHPLQFLQTTLRLTRLTGLVAKPLDKCLDIATPLLLLGVTRALQRQALCAKSLKTRIATAIEVARALFDMHDTLDHVV